MHLFRARCTVQVFTMHISATATLFTALYMIANSAAQDFIAWSGTTCDGSEGNNVPCDGSCHSFANQHSFAVSDISTTIMGDLLLTWFIYTL